MKLFLALFLAVPALTFSGCSNALTQNKPPDRFVVYGYVRSVWKIPSKDGDWNEPGTLFGIECADGEVIVMATQNIEPRMWSGMHVKLTYVADENGDLSPIFTYDGSAEYFIIRDVERLP